jgi:hypothetical protein
LWKIAGFSHCDTPQGLKTGGLAGGESLRNGDLTGFLLAESLLILQKQASFKAKVWP